MAVDSFWAEAAHESEGTPAYPPFVAVGAGRMGRGIAIAFAYAGQSIALLDLRTRSDEAWATLRAEVDADIHQALEGLAAIGCIQDPQVDEIANRIHVVRATQAPECLAGARMVFEGVPETLEAKKAAFDVINAHCPDNTILTSTTSSILVDDMVALVRKPAQFLNMHWLNPAYVIPVVEISTHAQTSAAVLQRTRDIMTAIGKVPVVCGAAPGYIVPRLQALIMNEAARMVEEGVATPEEIDKATRFGLGLRFAAMGVVEFIDFGGCDILHHASREMARSVDASRYTAPAIVDAQMAQNRLGLKTASGFYDYSGRDLAAYRRDVLARTVGMARHLDLWRAPAQ